MIHTINKIIREAGERILKIYNSGPPETWTKDDGSPVTEADLASHEWIQDSLVREFNIPVISEEAEIPPFSEREQWDQVFLVDPLDGTKDFLARNGEFTINIVLIRSGKPQLAAVYIPALGELFYGERGKGAWYCSADELIRLTGEAPVEPTLARAHFFDNQTVEGFAQKNKITRNVKMSSAVRLPRLAQGVVNLVLTSNRASEWDVAAGHLLVTECGGEVRELSTGEEPCYNKPNIKSDFLLATAANMTDRNWKLPANKTE